MSRPVAVYHLTNDGSASRSAPRARCVFCMTLLILNPVDFCRSQCRPWIMHQAERWVQ